jgi:hypothetical protein
LYTLKTTLGEWDFEKQYNVTAFSVHRSLPPPPLLSSKL